MGHKNEYRKALIDSIIKIRKDINALRDIEIDYGAARGFLWSSSNAVLHDICVYFLKERNIEQN